MESSTIRNECECRDLPEEIEPWNNEGVLVESYVSPIVVFGRDEEVHDKKLRLLLQRCCETEADQEQMRVQTG